MDCSTPVFPIYHRLLDLAQTYIHWVSDAIQPSHPLSSHSFIRVFSNQSAVHIRWPKYWSFSFSISLSKEYSGLNISFRIDWVISLKYKGLSRVFSNITVQKHQFFRAQLSLWSSTHIQQMSKFANKGLSSQNCDFPIVMYGCENWALKKAEHRRIDAFELWCWRRHWESLGLQGDQASQS